MPPSKIRVVAVEELQRALDSEPECRVEEVTKLQAIRMLLPQIHAMQSKGYGLAAIAGRLSEGGVAVTALTLKSYLTQAKTAGGKKSRRKTKARRESEPGAQVAAKGAPSAGDAMGGKAPAETREAVRGGGKGGQAVAPVSPAVAAPAPAKGPVRPADEGAARRSAFVPKEDTRDI